MQSFLSTIHDDGSANTAFDNNQEEVYIKCRIGEIHEIKRSDEEW